MSSIVQQEIMRALRYHGYTLVCRNRHYALEGTCSADFHIAHSDVVALLQAGLIAMDGARSDMTTVYYQLVEERTP